MCGDVRRLGMSTTDEDILEVVRQHFPGDMYELLLQRAQAESQSKQASMDRAVREGKWVWV